MKVERSSKGYEACSVGPIAFCAKRWSAVAKGVTGARLAASVRGIGRSRSRSAERAMTLLEVVVAIVVLMTVLVPAAMLLTSTAKVAADQRFQTTASTLATRQLDCVEENPFWEVNQCAADSSNTPPQSPAPFELTDSGILFKITQDESLSTTATSSFSKTVCLRVEITVSWTSNGTRNHLRAASLTHCQPTPTVFWYPTGNPGAITLDFDAFGTDYFTQKTTYLDAAPGQQSPPQEVTLKMEAPQDGYSGGYVVISNMSIQPSSLSSYFTLSGNCKGAHLETGVAGEPDSCTEEVSFDPPTTSQPNQAVSARLVFSDNAEAGGGSSLFSQFMPLSGWVSGDLLTGMS